MGPEAVQDIVGWVLSRRVPPLGPVILTLTLPGVGMAVAVGEGEGEGDGFDVGEGEGDGLGVGVPPEPPTLLQVFEDGSFSITIGSTRSAPVAVSRNCCSD